MVPRDAGILGRIPKGVWVLAASISADVDVSSAVNGSLLPLFMATTLGASVIIIGLIENHFAEATFALIMK